MKTLLLSKNDVESILTMEGVIEAVKDGQPLIKVGGFAVTLAEGEIHVV